MNLISPKVELLKQEDTLDGIYKQIELAGRTCYKSEDKITESSAKKFVDKMIKSGHTAMLEHGTVYLITVYNNYMHVVYNKNPYSIVKVLHNTLFITTNYRVLVENDRLSDLQYLCKPTEYHERRITMKFTTNIGVTREGNRHRVNSIAEESTRYCNYTKDKFGKQITFCKPTWITEDMIEEITKNPIVIKEGLPMLDFDNFNNVDDNNLKAAKLYFKFLSICQETYNNLIELGWTPQQAREVLPLATKSNVVYTAFVSDWRHWFDLRLNGTTGKPHPNMQEIAELAKEVLEENNMWNYILNKKV